MKLRHPTNLCCQEQKHQKNQADHPFFFPTIADSKFWNILFKDDVIMEMMIAKTNQTLTNCLPKLFDNDDEK